MLVRSIYYILSIFLFELEMSVHQTKQLLQKHFELQFWNSKHHFLESADCLIFCIWSWKKWSYPLLQWPDQLLKSSLNLSTHVSLLHCKRLESITSPLQPIFVPEMTIICLAEWFMEITKLASFSPLRWFVIKNFPFLIVATKQKSPAHLAPQKYTTILFGEATWTSNNWETVFFSVHWKWVLFFHFGLLLNFSNKSMKMPCTGTLIEVVVLNKHVVDETCDCEFCRHKKNKWVLCKKKSNKIPTFHFFNILSCATKFPPSNFLSISSCAIPPFFPIYPTYFSYLPYF